MLKASSVFDQTTPLPPSQAFVFYTDNTQDGTLVLKWDIAPGYFLYKDKLSLKTIPAIAIENTRLPLEQHPRLLSGTIEWPLHYDLKDLPFKVTVYYQGCASSGFCYPPQAITISVPEILALHHSPPFLGKVVTFFLVGLLLAFSPCMLPMLPILFGILVRKKPVPTHSQALWLSSCYVLGMASTYAIAGLTFAFLGQHLQSTLQTPLILGITAGFFIFLGYAQYGYVSFALPTCFQSKIQHRLQRFKQGHALGALAMGIVSSLVLSPCITPPLVGSLGYIAETGDLLGGGLALFALGLGMGTPLLILCSFGQRVLPKTGPWMLLINEILAMLLFVMAIWLLGRFLPKHSMELLFGILSLFLAARAALKIKPHWLKGILICTCCCVGFLSWNKVLTSKTFNDTVPNIENTASLNKELYLAKKLHKPVVLEFYADWCSSCRYFDTVTRHEAAFKQALSHWHLIRVNITRKNAETENLLRDYHIIAPPTFIFLDPEGQEIQTRRHSGTPLLDTFVPISS